MSRPEILAPAGNREMLGAAVFSGADAVYLGLTGFNARRTAGNFTPDELREAVVFCHARGVKVHVTLNTLVYDRELSGLADAVRAVAAAGADAVISDDLATAQLVKSIAPTLHLHGSTQMSVHTPEGAKELAALGYDRVILARELSLEEIRAVCEASPIEVEVFVHGALCMSVSGQCMMSAFLGGRSGNRGACAGPCRLPFDASAGLKPGQPGRACHLSLKDMDYIPHLRELMDAGVASVKIEGRLRTPEYAAAVVTACRAVCAGQPYDEKLVRDIFSRSGFTDGYLTNRNDGKMFGVRTEADAAATRAATPKARELFRRELQRVPVHYELSGGVEDGGVKLTARDDDGHRVSVYSADEPQPAQKDPLPGIERALGKTGGTPFVMDGLAAEPGEGGFGFLPGAAWNELRREALDKLLEKRSEVTPHAVQAFEMPTYPAHTVGQLPALAARFANAAQCPAEAAEKLQYLIFPIAEAESIPEAWRGENAAGAAAGHVRQARAKDRRAAGRPAGRGFCRGGGQQPRTAALYRRLDAVRRSGPERHEPDERRAVCVPGGAGHAFAARDRADGHAGRGPRRAHGGALLRPSAADADPRLPPAQCARLRQMPGRRHAAGPQGPRLHRDLLDPRRGGRAHSVQPGAALHGRAPA